MNAIVRKERGAGVRSVCRCFALLLLLFVGMGCKGSGGAHTDPILGPVRPAAGGGKAAGGPSAIPDIPASPGTTSTAALAPGTNGTLGRGSDLRIGDGATGQTAGRNGAVLGKPEPIRDPMSAATPVSIPITVPVQMPTPTPTSAITLTGGPGPRIQTVEQGLAWLEARGVRGARLEFVQEAKEWRFACSLPNRDNPRLRRTHETQARDPLSAVQAVIEQIEREQH